MVIWIVSGSRVSRPDSLPVSCFRQGFTRRRREFPANVQDRFRIWLRGLAAAQRTPPLHRFSGMDANDFAGLNDGSNDSSFGHSFPWPPFFAKKSVRFASGPNPDRKPRVFGSIDCPHRTGSRPQPSQVFSNFSLRFF